jgi:hypothetical protein
MAVIGFLLIAGTVVAYVVGKTKNRVQVEFDIHINKELVYLSMNSEPPQFAVWLENPANHKRELVFVTHRASVGDWEGKADVPVAIPFWTSEFKNEDKAQSDAVTGATPKEEVFRVRVEVKPGSEWIAWIEMNLAGDFNEYYQQFNRTTMVEDEFFCGQPALLYRTEIKADKGNTYKPEIYKMSLWNEGINTLAPVDKTITSAQNVFDDISIEIIRPKPEIINLKKIEKQDIFNPIK